MFVVLAGQFGRYSIGSEIALASVRDLVRSRWQAAGLIVVTSFPETLQRKLGLPAVGWWNLMALPHLLLRARAWIILDEDSSSPFTALPVVAAGILSRMTGVCCTVVRARTPRGAAADGFAVKNISFRPVADAGDGASRMSYLSDDPALLTPAPDIPRPGSTGSPPRIVCLISDESRHTEDPDAWAKTADTMVQRLGAVIIFVSENVLSPAYFVHSAIARMRTIGRLAMWNSSRDFLSVIAGADIVICQSSTAVIAAASCGVPSLTVTNSQRIRAICAQFEQKCVSADLWATPSCIVAHVLDVWEWREVFRENIKRTLPTFRLAGFRRIERILAPLLD